MGDIDFAAAKTMASRPHTNREDANLRAAYLTALEALEREASGRPHDMTRQILGPRMPDRPKHIRIGVTSDETPQALRQDQAQG